MQTQTAPAKKKQKRGRKAKKAKDDEGDDDGDVDMADADADADDSKLVNQKKSASEVKREKSAARKSFRRDIVKAGAVVDELFPYASQYHVYNENGPYDALLNQTNISNFYIVVVVVFFFFFPKFLFFYFQVLFYYF